MTKIQPDISGRIFRDDLVKDGKRRAFLESGKSNTSENFKSTSRERKRHNRKGTFQTCEASCKTITVTNNHQPTVEIVRKTAQA